MAFEDTVRSVREFDFGNLDLDNVGSWPIAIKISAWVLLLALVLVGGFYYHIDDLQLELAAAEEKELDLKKDFETKAFQAANLDAYRQQMVEMEESFGALVSQLPSETEVPGLLEDITNKGLLNGLDIAVIDLQSEKESEFYIELPIEIVASGLVPRFGRIYQCYGGLAENCDAA